MQRLLAVLAALALGGWFAWSLYSGDRSTGAEAAAEHPPAGASAPSDSTDLRAGSMDEPDVARELGATSSAQEPRVALAPRARLRVQDANGAALPGATVTRTRVEAFLPESAWQWDEIGSAWWSAATEEAVTNERGAIATEELTADDPDWGGVLWFSRPGALTGFELLPPESDLAGRTFALDVAAPVRVRVVDASGEPVPSATVEATGVELFPEPRAAAPHYAPFLYRRRHATDASGNADLAAFPGRQAVRARLGERVSRPRVLDADAREVTLTLQPGFTIGGTVNRPTLPEGSWGVITPRVTIAIERGSLFVPLGTASAQADDTWGPLTLPVIADARYVVRVHGVAVLTTTRPLTTPAPGDEVTLHLDTEMGLTQWCEVVDTDGRPIAGATATLSWQENGRVESAWRTTSAEGYAEVMGVRPGPVAGVASAPGYATQVQDPLQLPASQPFTRTFILREGATITGRVLRDGAPVTDFELLHWTGTSTPQRRMAFLDRADGRFELRDVPRGTVGLMASSADSPGSDPIFVETGDGPIDVVLELNAPLVGRGVVVAARTGLPIEGAVARPQLTSGVSFAGPWGPPLSTDVDGAFEAAAFSGGDNIVIASAPGFGERLVVGRAANGEVDFGRIELSPAVDLRVELAGPHAFDPFYFWLNGKGPQPIALSRFQPEGDDYVATASGIGAGLYRLNLETPYGSQRVYFDVGTEGGVVRFHEGDGGALRVKILGDDPTSNRTIALVFESPPGFSFVKHVEARGKDEHLIRGVPPGPVTVQLLGGASSTLAEASATAVEGQVTDVALERARASATLTVRDADGEPLAGVFTGLRALEGDAFRGGRTDGAGELEYPGLKAGRYLLNLTHEAGVQADIELSVAEDEHHEWAFTLKGDVSLVLALRDGDEPLAGIGVRAVDRLGRAVVNEVLSDAAGAVTFARLNQGSYRIEVEGRDVWATGATLVAHAEPVVQELQVRRLGDLEARAIQADGLPVADVEFELTHAELGEDVAAWIEAGRVAGPSPLAFDKAGKLNITGLPRGTYTWRVGGQQGAFELKAQGLTQVLIGIE